MGILSRHYKQLVFSPLRIWLFKDLKKLAVMLEQGEEEVFQKQFVTPFVYKDNEGGIIYDRRMDMVDDLMDNWHPWEKANYMDYFEKRKKLKEEIYTYWDQSLSKKYQGVKRQATEFPIISKEVAAL